MIMLIIWQIIQGIGHLNNKQESKQEGKQTGKQKGKQAECTLANTKSS